MQADCLYRCLKQRVTGGPLDSMSSDVTFFSGSSIILLHCQAPGRPVQADLLNGEAISPKTCFEGSEEKQPKFKGKTCQMCYNFTRLY